MDRREEYNPLPLVYNHFEVIKGISTKDGLVRSLKRYYENNPDAGKSNLWFFLVSAGYGAFDSTPTSYVVSANLDDADYYDFKKRYADLAKGFCMDERVPNKHCKLNMWLVKPSNQNQGRGIEIFKNLR